MTYYEIELCKALNFQFYVHNPLSVIHHLKNIFPQDELMDKAMDIVEEICIIHFKSMELTFCYTPNTIACAALQISLQTVGSAIDCCEYLQLPAESRDKVASAIGLLNEI